MVWTGERKLRLPPDWGRRRRLVIIRDKGMCQYQRSDGRKCGSKGTEVDHLEPGDNHDLSNLRLLCSWHHKRKTQREAQAARQAKVDALKTPEEPHPGRRKRKQP